MRKPRKTNNQPVSKEKCPICGSSEYMYKYWTEFGWGTVEQHGRCKNCGYMIEQAYSEPIVGFERALRRGYQNKWDGKYYPADWRHIRRMRRKFGIKYGKNKDDWTLAMI